MENFKEVFDGEYYPSESVVPTSLEYVTKRKEYNEIQTRLEQVLGAENEPLLSAFLDVQADIADLMNYEFFLEGIRFGISFAKEVRAKEISD